MAIVGRAVLLLPTALRWCAAVRRRRRAAAVTRRRTAAVDLIGHRRGLGSCLFTRDRTLALRRRRATIGATTVAARRRLAHRRRRGSGRRLPWRLILGASPAALHVSAATLVHHHRRMLRGRLTMRPALDVAATAATALVLRRRRRWRWRRATLHARAATLDVRSAALAARSWRRWCAAMTALDARAAALRARRSGARRRRRFPVSTAGARRRRRFPVSTALSAPLERRTGARRRRHHLVSTTGAGAALGRRATLDRATVAAALTRRAAALGGSAALDAGRRWRHAASTALDVPTAVLCARRGTRRRRRCPASPAFSAPLRGCTGARRRRRRAASALDAGAALVRRTALDGATVAALTGSAGRAAALGGRATLRRTAALDARRRRCRRALGAVSLGGAVAARRLHDAGCRMRRGARLDAGGAQAR